MNGTTKVATPIEFGATNLISSDPIKHSNKGAIGSLIIEPQGSTWIEDELARAGDRQQDRRHLVPRIRPPVPDRHQPASR